MFTFLVQLHFDSSFANKATLLIATLLIATLELTMFVVLIIVHSQDRMSLVSSGTLAAHPFGSVRVMRFEMSFQLFPGNWKNITKNRKYHLLIITYGARNR